MKPEIINPVTMKALRDIYMMARSNGLSIAKASAVIANKAHALNVQAVRKYVQLIVEQVDGGEDPP